MTGIFVEEIRVNDRNQEHFEILKKIQDVIFKLLHISDDPGFDILPHSWNTVFLSNLFHKIMELHKILPNEQSFKIFNRSNKLQL